MRVLYAICVFFTTSHASSTSSEQGTYVNPNPRQYENCEVQDLVLLSACCNDVLNKLDECKANDLACECCALQSMKKECYGLCPGNPSNNFLTTLFDDCASMNDINACNLPFVKDDSTPTVKNKQKVVEPETESSIILKSKVQSKGEYDDSDDLEASDDGLIVDGVDEEEEEEEEGGIHEEKDLEGNQRNTTNEEYLSVNPSSNATKITPTTYTNSSMSSNISYLNSTKLESPATYTTWNSIYIGLACLLATFSFFT